MPGVALGALLATLAMVMVVALRPVAEPGPVERADALASELRCPDCQGLSVGDSPTASAREIRRQIDELVAAGASDAEVRAHFVARYGEWVLLAPASPAAWLLPFVVVAGGAVALAAWLSSRRAPLAGPRTALSAEERRRLREEAEALDG